MECTASTTISTSRHTIHDLCNALHTLLKTHGADSKAQKHHDDHESSHQRGIGQHTAEFTGHCLCIHAAEIPLKGF